METNEIEMVCPFALTTELGTMLLPASLGSVHMVEGPVPPQALSFSKANSHNDCIHVVRVYVCSCGGSSILQPIAIW